MLGFKPIKVNTVPSHSKSGIPKGFGKPPKTEYTIKEGSKSVFHLVVNINVDDRKLTEEQKAKWVDVFTSTFKEFKTILETSSRFIKFGKNHTVEDFTFNMEVGEKVYRLHLDGVIVIKPFTLLNLDEIRKFLTEKFGMKPYLYCRAINDEVQILKNYSAKQNIKKII